LAELAVAHRAAQRHVERREDVAGGLERHAGGEDLRADQAGA
jgi:hypothetical protein